MEADQARTAMREKNVRTCLSNAIWGVFCLVFLHLFICQNASADIARNPEAKIRDISEIHLNWGRNDIELRGTMRVVTEDGEIKENVQMSRKGRIFVLPYYTSVGGTNAHSVFFVTTAGVLDLADSWSIVPIGESASVGDQPHTGEDYITSVHFYNGTIDDVKTTCVFVAERQLSNLSGPSEEAHVRIRIYVLDGGVIDRGSISDGPSFTQFREFVTKHRYHDADDALVAEAHVPQPTIDRRYGP